QFHQLHIQCFAGPGLRLDPSACIRRCCSNGVRPLPDGLHTASLWSRYCHRAGSAVEGNRTGYPSIVLNDNAASIDRRDLEMQPKTGTGKYERVLERCTGYEPIPTAVAYPCESTSLSGPVEAEKRGLIVRILVGRADKKKPTASSSGIDLQGFEVVDAPNSGAAAARAVELIRKGEAELLMKGSLHTDELMAAVVARETGLRTGRPISHVFVMDVPPYHKVPIVTYGASHI